MTRFVLVVTVVLLAIPVAVLRMLLGVRDRR